MQTCVAAATFCISALCTAVSGRAEGDYTFARIVTTFGTVEALGIPSISRCGMTAGSIMLEGQPGVSQRAVFYSDGSSFDLVSSLQSPLKSLNRRVVISDAGHVTFWSADGSGEAIHLASVHRPGLTAIALEGDFETMAPYGDPSVNQAGRVAFGAARSPVKRGMYIGDGEEIEVVAETMSPGKFYSYPSINAHGRVAYRCHYPSGAVAVFLSRPGPDELIAFTDFPPFVELFYPAVNTNNQVAFCAVVDYGFGLLTGVSRGTGSNATPLVESGASSAKFGRAVPVTRSGTVPFWARLADGSTSGVFTGYDPVLHKVICTGDALDGSTVVDLTFESSRGLNDRGQIVFRAQLADGRSGVYRADPPHSNCPADIDGDGWVGQSDIGILIACMGVDDGGDVNCDGVTDQSDLGIVLEAYGAECP